MDEILNRIQTHFTPSELIEFLGVSFQDLFDSAEIQQAIEDNFEALKEEIGIE